MIQPLPVVPVGIFGLTFADGLENNENTTGNINRLFLTT
jgi:hypothetical protein